MSCWTENGSSLKLSVLRSDGALDRDGGGAVVFCFGLSDAPNESISENTSSAIAASFFSAGLCCWPPFFDPSRFAEAMLTGEAGGELDAFSWNEGEATVFPLCSPCMTSFSRLALDLFGADSGLRVTGDRDSLNISGPFESFVRDGSKKDLAVLLLLAVFSVGSSERARDGPNSAPECDSSLASEDCLWASCD